MQKRMYVAAIMGLAVFSSPILAEDKLSFGASADYFGKYVWRGQDLSDDPVFQPSVSGVYGPLTASLWGNMDTTNINGNSGDFSELDTSLDLTNDMPGIEGLKYTVGAIYYDFPGTNLKDTTEVYGGLIASALPLSPFVKMYRDVDEYTGTYYQFGIGHTFEKVQTWGESCYCNIALGASVGYANSDYNAAYWGVDSSEWNDLTLTAGLPICIGSWTVKPSLNYVTLLSRDLRNADTYNSSSDYFYAGVGISTTF